jgi:hypothetical protein
MEEKKQVLSYGVFSLFSVFISSLCFYQFTGESEGGRKRREEGERERQRGERNKEKGRERERERLRVAYRGVGAVCKRGRSLQYLQKVMRREETREDKGIAERVVEVEDKRVKSDRKVYILFVNLK